jgi:hypothetical protein
MLARQDAWLAAYAKSGSVSIASADSGVPLGTLDEWASSDLQGFKARKANAAHIALGLFEREIQRRAVEGTEKGVWHNGKRVGAETQYSDNLLMFRTKRLDAQYKDNYAPPPTSTNVKITKVTIVMPSDDGSDAVEVEHREVRGVQAIVEGPEEAFAEEDTTDGTLKEQGSG